MKTKTAKTTRKTSKAAKTAKKTPAKKTAAKKAVAAKAKTAKLSPKKHWAESIVKAWAGSAARNKRYKKAMAAAKTPEAKAKVKSEFYPGRKAKAVAPKQTAAPVASAPAPAIKPAQRVEALSGSQRQTLVLLAMELLKISNA